MVVPVVLRALVRGTTYRRGVHLLLGAVILLPYVLLGRIFVTMLADSTVPRLATSFVLVVAVAIAIVPAFLGGTRSLEIAAARSLLGVDLPEPVPPAPGAGVAAETRLRGALWFAVHLVAGGLVGLALLMALPMALMFIVHWFGVRVGPVEEVRLGPLDAADAGWLSLLGVGLVIAVVYAVAGLGALAAMMAPVLLGPSVTERIAALEARADQLTERNRLARELHDSVGHALTVATVQAGAARELFDTDPEFARRALTAIEETARDAMAELDHVLGLLREPGGGARGPQRTLADVDRLVADARGAGLPIRAEVTGPVADVPAAVSREGYRIVQEGLTNAVRHAGGAAVTVRVAVSAQALDIALANATTTAAGGEGEGDRGGSDGSDAGRRAGEGGGRGLAGMRERVALLGGRMTVDDRDGTWRVAVQLPTGRPRGRATGGGRP
ncbi:MAG TPA: histidine kinase [Pilimelia sp.]|nr:histidine kinase [Pilimelia sp.]